MIHTIYIENVNIMNTARPQLFACAELVPGYANGYMYIYFGNDIIFWCIRRYNCIWYWHAHKSIILTIQKHNMHRIVPYRKKTCIVLMQHLYYWYIAILYIEQIIRVHRAPRSGGTLRLHCMCVFFKPAQSLWNNWSTELQNLPYIERSICVIR